MAIREGGGAKRTKDKIRIFLPFSKVHKNGNALGECTRRVQFNRQVCDSRKIKSD